MSSGRHLTAVVCRDRAQFRAWCLDNDRSPRDRSLHLVTEERHMRGQLFEGVILVDGPSELMEAAQTRVRTNRRQEQR